MNIADQQEWTVQDMKHVEHKLGRFGIENAHEKILPLLPKSGCDFV